MNIREIPAIDVHGHYGLYVGHIDANRARFMTASAAEVAQRALATGIAWTVVSPLLGLFPRGRADAVAGNEEAQRLVPATPGLLQWAILDPTNEATYEQVDRLLQQRQCVGIKIHPEEHVYPIVKHGRAIFEFAAARRAVILTHSGELNSLPEDLVVWANEFPEAKLILAHIGCGWNGDPLLQVRAIQKSRHGNVYADTSSAQSILPHLIETAVAEVGAQRVLFGTDTPLYSAAMQRARIDLAEISEPEKKLILRDNAVALLNLGKHLSAAELARHNPSFVQGTTPAPTAPARAGA